MFVANVFFFLNWFSWYEIFDLQLVNNRSQSLNLHTYSDGSRTCIFSSLFDLVMFQNSSRASCKYKCTDSALSPSSPLILLCVRHSLWARPEKAVLLVVAELLAAELEPPPPRGMLSSGGNWKGSDTGTIPPSMP